MLMDDVVAVYDDIWENFPLMGDVEATATLGGWLCRVCFGEKWYERHLKRDAHMYLRFPTEADGPPLWSHRLGELGFYLLITQECAGWDRLIASYKPKEDMDGLVGELRTAAMLLLGGNKVEFMPPLKDRPMFDLKVTQADGLVLNVEVKTKTDAAVKRSIKQELENAAGKQLPEGAPSVIVLSMPSLWSHEEMEAAPFREEIADCFQVYPHIDVLITVWESWKTRAEGGYVFDQIVHASWPANRPTPVDIAGLKRELTAAEANDPSAGPPLLELVLRWKSNRPDLPVLPWGS